MLVYGELPLFIGSTQAEIKKYEQAIIGQDDASLRVVYSADKIIEILSEEMTPEEAEEFYEYNILGAYMGDMTPIYVSEHGSINELTVQD